LGKHESRPTPPPTSFPSIMDPCPSMIESRKRRESCQSLDGTFSHTRDLYSWRRPESEGPASDYLRWGLSPNYLLSFLRVDPTHD
jgi:hypothetical protein